VTTTVNIKIACICSALLVYLYELLDVGQRNGFAWPAEGQVSHARQKPQQTVYAHLSKGTHTCPPL
jgi:hypothetical protein